MMNALTHAEKLQNAALEYYSQGYTPIPVDVNKSALIKWKNYQESKPTMEEVNEWFRNPECSGIALLTGKYYELVVLDVEKEGLEVIKNFEMPDTVVSKSGGGGKHFYFKYPKDSRIKNAVGVMKKCDVRGDGGYIIVPPSLHQSGGEYIWDKKLSHEILKEAPSWLLTSINKGAKKSFDINKNVSEGERNSTAAQAVGTFLVKYNDEQKAFEKLTEWNEARCVPPLYKEELKTIFDSILKRHSEQKALQNNDAKLIESEKHRKSKADRLVELVLLKCEKDLFLDQNKEAFVRVKVGSHYEVMACNSSRFREIMTNWLWNDERRTPSKEDLNTATMQITSKAKFESNKQFNLDIRVTEKKETIYYDLADDECRVVKIDKDGWAIEPSINPLFRRFSHQEKQYDPIREGADIKKVFKYVNLRNEHQKLLLLVFIVTSFISSLPHAIAVIYGAQGSAKTTFSKILKKIIDPSGVDSLTFPKNETELIQQLSHHWLAAYDNISTLQEWATDCLCMCVTGGGMTKRALYTDDEDKIYNLRRVLLLNGINLVSTKPDLLDRSILFELERISPNQRLTEKELWEGFNKDLPAIIGGTFNILSKAISIYKDVKLLNKPRLADLAQWGAAISLALGYTQQEFEEALKTNGLEQNECILADDPVASAIVEFMKEKSDWCGTPTELRNEICIKDGKIINAMPRSPNKLSKKINIIKTTLTSIGIQIEPKKDTEGKRGRFIKIHNEVSSLPSQSSEIIYNSDGNDDKDDDNSKINPYIMEDDF